MPNELMRLTLLAPDILELLMAGGSPPDEPDCSSATRCRRTGRATPDREALRGGRMSKKPPGPVQGDPVTYQLPNPAACNWKPSCPGRW